jgi:hypothetical protein
MITKYSRRRAIKSAAATVALMGMPNLLESQAPLGTARVFPVASSGCTIQRIPETRGEERHVKKPGAKKCAQHDQ